MDDGLILRIWNKFSLEQQNMPFAQFRKELKDLSDPVKIRQDLAEIELQRATMRTNKIRIDKALEKNDGSGSISK